jgi:hypothetical protein
MAAVRSSEYTSMASGQDRRGEAIVVKRREEVEARGGGKQARKKTASTRGHTLPLLHDGWYSRVTHRQRRGWTVKHLTLIRAQGHP